MLSPRLGGILERLARRQTSPQRLICRLQIVPATRDGLINDQIARRFGFRPRHRAHLARPGPAPRLPSAGRDRDTFGANQARTKLEQAREAVQRRLPETHLWLLAPEQPDPTGPVEWLEARLGGPEKLAVRAARKLRNDMALLVQMADTILQRELERIPLWRGDHVGVRQLADDFAQYLYLPRLRDTDVLLGALEEGTALPTWRQDTFAYAEGRDDASGLYRGLRTGERVTPILDDHSLLVRPAVAIAQRELEQERPPRDRVPGSDGDAKSDGDTESGEPDDGGTWVRDGGGAGAGRPRTARRFHGSASLSPTRLSRDADQVAREVVTHLTSLLGADVRVTLEIAADVPAGVPDDIVRTVTENRRALRFSSNSGFETE